MSEWTAYTLGEVTKNFDSVRVPVKSTERVPGPYPYYGASGVVDRVSEYLFDGEYLLIAEDGENLRTRKTPVAFIATGKFWVNNHAHVVRGNHLANTRFLCYRLALTDISGHLSGSTQPKLTQASLNAIKVKLPGRGQQDAVVDLLRALDDKIAVNEHIAVTAEALANAHYRDERGDLTEVPERLGTLAKVVVGGTPSRSRPEYWSGGTINWINSGKANDFRVVEPSEMITEEGLAGSSVKLMPPGATLIGITGATMGQVSRLEITAGGSQNVAGVWSDDPALNDWLFYDIQARVADLIKHASGGAQQHINKRIIVELECVVPGTMRLAAWSAKTSPLVKLAAQVLMENRTLAALRDTLLPPLMSGRLRVKDAEKIVEDNT
ncbi:restriction endonuclease subunit S [Streptomyces halstedii]|uniref:restriction endonuclease subunit S n=1 Tax=Streptomyces halstedii TaxID=1944 RepID=UPI0034615368